MAATMLVWSCGSASKSGTSDGGAPDSGSPDAGSASCRVLGAFVRDPRGPLRTVSGAPFHPENIVADPFVLFVNGGYRLWFSSADWTLGTVFNATDRVLGTAYAESSDGFTWDDSHLAPEAGHKISLVLKPGAWDANGVETPSVALRGPGDWVLDYTGDRPDGSSAIGEATSSDGIAWTRSESPLLEPSNAWEQPVCTDPPGCTQYLGGVLEPSTLFKAGVQNLWYAGFGTLDDSFSIRIGHAWTDGGVPWQRAALPVFSPGGAGAWDEILVSQTDVVSDSSGGLHLFYQGVSSAQQAICSTDGSCPFYTPGSIGHAYSADGTTWTRDASPVLVPDASAGEGFFVGGPSVVFRDGRAEMYYFAIASQDDAENLAAHLSLATAPCVE